MTLLQILDPNHYIRRYYIRIRLNIPPIFDYSVTLFLASWFNDLLALERWIDFMTGPGGSGNPPMAPKPCIFPVNKVETDLVD